jgi:hypothetical protein
MDFGQGGQRLKGKSATGAIQARHQHSGGAFRRWESSQFG